MIKKAVLTLCLTLFLLSNALGEEEKETLRLEDIVVTATRTVHIRGDLPVATTVITREDLDNLNYRDVGEALRGATGLDIKGYGPLGSDSSVSIRGSASAQVLVLIDGRPVNSITTGSAGLSEISLTNVERIEIIRSPSSHLYGANALGGVVNIITKQPPGETRGKLRGSYGSFNTQVYQLEQGATIKSLGYLFSLGWKDSSGFRDNSDYRSGNVSTKLDYIVEENTIKANFDYSWNKLGLPGPLPPVGEPPIYGNEEVTSLYDEQEGVTFSGDISLSWLPEEGSGMTLRLYQEQKIVDFTTRYDDWLSGDPLNEEDEYRANTLGMNLQYQLKLGEVNRLVVGSDIKGDRFRGTQKVTNINTGEVTHPNLWKPRTHNFGLWLEDELKVFSTFSVLPGIRFDSHSEYGSEWSPSIGAVFHPLNNTTLRASAGRAYRAPSFNDLYYPMGGNTDLDPEKGWAYEVGVEQGLLEDFLINCSVFFRNVKDLIAWVPVSETGLWEPQNVNEHTTLGVEAELEYRLSKLVLLRLSYTYLDAEQKNTEVVYDDFSGDVRTEEITRTAAFIPKQQGKLNVVFTPITGTQLSFQGRFVGERVAYYTNYDYFPEVSKDIKKTSSYFLCDAKVSQTLRKHMEIFLAIDNLFNEKDYIEQLGTSLNDRGYPFPGISFNGGMS
ncbi:MAG: TonB-dependent receptor, partial [Deltaproteobacteria bacterium]